MIVVNSLRPDPLGREELTVGHPRAGRGFTHLELDFMDFVRLRKMTPEQLTHWVEEWSLGFLS